MCCLGENRDMFISLVNPLTQVSDYGTCICSDCYFSLVAFKKTKRTMERTGNMQRLHWHNRDKKRETWKNLQRQTSTRGFVRYLLKHLTDGLGRSSEKSRSLSKHSRMGQSLCLIDFLWKLYVQEYTINHASLSLLEGKVPWICFSVKITPLKQDILHLYFLR